MSEECVHVCSLMKMKEGRTMRYDTIRCHVTYSTSLTSDSFLSKIGVTNLCIESLRSMLLFSISVPPSMLMLMLIPIAMPILMPTPIAVIVGLELELVMPSVNLILKPLSLSLSLSVSPSLSSLSLSPLLEPCGGVCKYNIDSDDNNKMIMMIIITMIIRIRIRKQFILNV